MSFVLAFMLSAGLEACLDLTVPPLHNDSTHVRKGLTALQQYEYPLGRNVCVCTGLDNLHPACGDWSSRILSPGPNIFPTLGYRQLAQVIIFSLRFMRTTVHQCRLTQVVAARPGVTVTATVRLNALMARS